jgi:hypothetical protein
MVREEQPQMPVGIDLIDHDIAITVSPKTDFHVVAHPVYTSGTPVGPDLYPRLSFDNGCLGACAPEGHGRYPNRQQ